VEWGDRFNFGALRVCDNGIGIRRSDREGMLRTRGVMTDKARNLESVFHEARRIHGDVERGAYLEKSCAGDLEMRERLERLLAADRELGSFLAAEETQLAPSGGRSRLGPKPASGSALSTEQPGTIIGRYKLLQQIGEGGFGVVYMAEQEQPVRRKVALKIIKLGMDTRDVIARFEQERQALAMMDHPNIARVLDAGATDTGRPYFVMELVKGIPITAYCDGQNMSFRDRLSLFVQVCGAVQHAHQKGIIHRDLKPSNVLVTHVDDKPVPKVIDFGIAKATQQKLTEQTMFTHFGQFMGTPAYMSPEQADPLGLDVDTRSDIYSLGVLLYELLTGATPFEINTLRGAALDEIKRIIIERDPPRPSTRLSTLGEGLPAVARQRGLEPKKLGTILRGELDWIIMKALEKDRTRRYETATEFARDIERYLNQEPVAAGPPSVSYRMQKFVRRNRTAVALATAGSIALVGFAATMAVQARRIALERDRANFERQMSDRVVEFQSDMLQRIVPRELGEGVAADLRGRIEKEMTAAGIAEERRGESLAAFDGMLTGVNLTDAARGILDAQILSPAVKTVEEKFANQPGVEGRLQQALAETFAALGLPEQAVLRSQRALELRREHLGPEHPDTLRTLSFHAIVLWDLSRNAESADALDSAIPLFERVLGPDDPDTLRAKMQRAILNVDRGMSAKAVKTYEDLAETQKRVLGPDHPDVALTLSNLGVALINQKDFTKAAPALERSVDIYSRRYGPDSARGVHAMQSLANAYVGLARPDEAVGLQRNAIQILEKERGARHPYTIKAINGLAKMYQDVGRLEEAESLARKAVELHRGTFGDSHRSTLSALTNLGIVLGLLGRHNEAGPIFVEAYESSKKVNGPDHQDTLSDLNNLAVHYWYVGQLQKSLSMFREYSDSMERAYGKDHPETAMAMGNVAVLYSKLGRLDEARVMTEQALAIRAKIHGMDHPETLQLRGSLATLEYESGNLEKSVEMYTELLPTRQTVLGVDHPLTIEAMYNLGVAKAKLGQTQEAMELIADSLERRRRVVGVNHDETLDTAAELARLWFEAGRVEEARKLYGEVISARREAAATLDASPSQLNDCALLLLTCKMEELRVPAEALKYARLASEATSGADPTILNTLARALFDTGAKVESVETQRKAIALLPEVSPTRSDYENRLAEYQGATP